MKPSQLFTIYNPETNMVYMSGNAPDPECYMNEFPGAVLKIGVDTGDPGRFMYDPVNECAVPYQRVLQGDEYSLQVNKERDRRIAHEFRFRGIAFQCDDKSFSAIQFAKLDGDGAEWIATDNSVHSFSDDDMNEFYDAAKAWRNQQRIAARRIKDTGIQDFTNPEHWS